MVGALRHPSDIQHVPLIKDDRHANHLEVNRSVTSYQLQLLLLSFRSCIAT